MDEASSHVGLDLLSPWRQGRHLDRSTSSSDPMMEDAMGGGEDIAFHRRW